MLTGVFLWVWCNGNTTDSKPVNGGSIPSTYANFIVQKRLTFVYTDAIIVT